MNIPEIVITVIISYMVWNKPKIRTNETEVTLEFNSYNISFRNKKLIQKNAITEITDKRETSKTEPKDSSRMNKAFSLIMQAFSLALMYIAGTKVPFIISPTEAVFVSIGFAFASLNCLGLIDW